MHTRTHRPHTLPSLRRDGHAMERNTHAREVLLRQGSLAPCIASSHRRTPRDIDASTPRSLGAEPIAVLLIHGGYWKNKYSIDTAAHATLAPFLASKGFYVVDAE